MLEFFRRVEVADARQIVDERVKPYVNHMFIVKGYGNAPIETRTRYAQIFQTAFHEFNHFIAARRRLNEIRIFFDELQPAIGVITHPEEIAFLLDEFDRSAAIGTGMVRAQFIFRPKRFVGRAIPAFVLRFIDIAFIIGFLEQRLHHFRMAFFRRADKIIIGNIQFFPQLLETGHDMIDVGLRRDASFFGFALNFLTVFIRTRQEKYIFAFQAVVPRQDVGERCAVGMTDMQLRARIVNRRRYIKSRFLMGLFH